MTFSITVGALHASEVVVIYSGTLEVEVIL